MTLKANLTIQISAEIPKTHIEPVMSSLHIGAEPTGAALLQNHSPSIKLTEAIHPQGKPHVLLLFFFIAFNL